MNNHQNRDQYSFSTTAKTDSPRFSGPTRVSSRVTKYPSGHQNFATYNSLHPHHLPFSKQSYQNPKAEPPLSHSKPTSSTTRPNRLR
ncbi:hypothetical protein HanRHA438_Chr05g0204331 [Helianthus annuus]|nr:hypothetical protein HanIR_Chr05g0210291 [Helianthus annuus]KAJ0917287.1 hypothetical protein HanRHA438_Chr05g0204331 [Helianthus annuus]